MSASEPQDNLVGFWLRAVAAIIDGILLTLVTWGFQYATLWSIYFVQKLIMSDFDLSFEDAFAPLFVQMTEVVFYTILSCLYYTLGHFYWGTTIGKKPLRIYVVSAEDESAVTMKQAMIRTACYLLSYLPMGAGFLMAAFHPKKQALHDIIAGTVSIRRPKKT